jgi:hypothetical protein
MDASFRLRQHQLFLWFAARHQSQVDTKAGLLPSADAYCSTGYELRASAYLALSLAQTGQAEQAWSILARVLEWQDRDRSSLTYGNYFWRTIWKADPGYVRDPNAASFIVPALVHLLRRGDLPGDLAGRVEESLALAGEALLAHRATWGYTNIALLNIAGKLLIGSALNDDRQRRLAYWDWEEWRNHTARMGVINETFSNCYTLVQLEALAQMLTCADADPGFRGEVRQALRHLLTACVQDFHPGIGRVTGTQSRAYLHDRRDRRGCAMDTVWYLLWGQGHIDPAIASHLWMGAQIGTEDILPQGQNLTLPRTTQAGAPGYRRINYLDEQFTLGSTHCTNNLIGVTTAAAVGYEGRSNHCLISFTPVPKAQGYWGAQDRSDLLAAYTWLSHPREQRDEEMLQIGEYSGLKTGRPTAVQLSERFRPGGFMELGPAKHVRVCDERSRPITAEGIIEGTAIALQYDRIRLFWRFFAPGGGAPSLSLEADATGELRLNVTLPPHGRPLEEGIDLSILGSWVAVEPITTGDDWADFIGRMARRACSATSVMPGWRLSLDGLERHSALQLAVAPSGRRFYGTDQQPVSPSRWGLSL